MPAYLYTNPKGYEVTRHSYSGSQTFNSCAKKYQLERLVGWTEKVKHAAPAFGTVMERGVAEFHRAGLESAKSLFVTEWSEQANKELEYSEKLKDHDNAHALGLELLRLYDILYPTFPFTIPNHGRMTAADIKSTFQIEYRMEVFPGTDLAGIEMTSYLDMLVHMKSGQTDPMQESEHGILDMKVSGMSCPILVELDPQLRTYAWVTDIKTVGFLWFEYGSRTFKAGDEVTLLAPMGPFRAGQKATVLSLDINLIPLNPPSLYLAPNSDIIEGLEKIPNRKDADKKRRVEFIQQYGIPVPKSDITKQRIELRLATISKASREDMRRQIENDIVRIHSANENNFWGMNSGVRFPHNPCVTCPMRGICTNNDQLRDELVTRDVKGGPEIF